MAMTVKRIKKQSLWYEHHSWRNDERKPIDCLNERVSEILTNQYSWELRKSAAFVEELTVHKIPSGIMKALRDAAVKKAYEMHNKYNGPGTNWPHGYTREDRSRYHKEALVECCAFCHMHALDEEMPTYDIYKEFYAMLPEKSRPKVQA